MEICRAKSVLLDGSESFGFHQASSCATPVGKERGFLLQPGNGEKFASYIACVDVCIAEP